MLSSKSFYEDYKKWWRDREENKPLRLELTCLILRICACSTQDLPRSAKHEIEAGSDQPIRTLSEIFHSHAQRLSAMVTPGHGGLFQVQQMTMAVSWFRTKSQWVESWHGLVAAIHEAQKQGERYANIAKLDVILLFVIRRVKSDALLIMLLHKGFTLSMLCMGWIARNKRNGAEPGTFSLLGTGKHAHSTDPLFDES